MEMGFATVTGCSFRPWPDEWVTDMRYGMPILTGFAGIRISFKLFLKLCFTFFAVESPDFTIF